jgi:hypothetical protein
VLHVSVVNDHHQAFINSEMHLTFITGLCVAMDPLLLVLSCRSFYIELQYLNILKYLFKIIKFILRLLLFSKSYPIVCRVFMGVMGQGEWCVFLHMICLLNFAFYGDVGVTRI